MSTSDFIAQLRAAVGEAHVLTSGDLTAYEQDWRKRARGKSLAVVRPANAEEVASVVRACVVTRTPIIAQGGNTGLVVGAIPDESGQQVVLSLQRMNAIRGIDRANLTVTVEAGCILQALQERARMEGLLFPLSLAAEGSCTIGGNLATNAGGTQVLRYGNTRDLCLGLEVVTAAGDIWHGTRGLRKDNTGYDLRNLLIGSEGTLGIITAATMKLYPLPAARLTAWVAVRSLTGALELLERSRRDLGAGLTGFEVMGRLAISLVRRHMPQLRVPFVDDEEVPYCVLIEYSDNESEAHARSRFEALLEAAFAADFIKDAVIAENLAQARQLWHIRESIPLAQAEEGQNIKHDISIPISRIPEFVTETDALLAREVPGARLVNFGHLGDGNLHYNVQSPREGDMKSFVRDEEARVNALVYGAVERFGGSLSAEHGVGLLKVKELEQYKSKVALRMMHAIKLALDPQNILNPGRVLSNSCGTTRTQ